MLPPRKCGGLRKLMPSKDTIMTDVDQSGVSMNTIATSQSQSLPGAFVSGEVALIQRAIVWSFPENQPNWTAQEKRMWIQILAACSEELVDFLTKLSQRAERLEAQVHTSANPLIVVVVVVVVVVVIVAVSVVEVAQDAAAAEAAAAAAAAAAVAAASLSPHSTPRT